ncbi:MAG: type II toxin-antitoxin system Phd/YefM family antitoxin, partial [Longimicrobiales bacterium]
QPTCAGGRSAAARRYPHAAPQEGRFESSVTQLAPHQVGNNGCLGTQRCGLMDFRASLRLNWSNRPNSSEAWPGRVNLYEAKTQLSKLVEEAAAGEEIIIAKGGKPKARLVALAAAKRARKPGGWAGQIWMSDDFDEELPPAELGVVR